MLKVGQKLRGAKGEEGRGPGLVISTQDGEKHNGAGRASPSKRVNRLPNIKALMSNRSSLPFE